MDDISNFFTQQLMVNDKADRITLTSYQESTEENKTNILHHNEMIKKTLKNCQRKY